MDDSKNGHYRPPVVIPPNIGKPGGPRLVDVLTYHLNVKMQKYVGKSLNSDTMSSMYENVCETVHSMFAAGSHNVHQDARDWLSQKMYETIRVGDSPVITRDEETWKHGVHRVYEPVSLSNIPDPDLRLIAGLFSESSFAPQILNELKRRNMR